MSGLPDFKPYKMPTLMEFPSNLVSWQINPDRAILLIHDMQKYFLRAFNRNPPGPELIGNVTKLRIWADFKQIPIAYTAQPGNMTQKQRGLLRDFWGEGMQSAPDERDIVTELSPKKGDWQITKWRYSAFFNNDLLQRIRSSGRDQIIIGGIFAYLGITVTAVEAYSNDIQAFVIGDAVADFNRDRHRAALNYIASSCGCVKSTDEVLS